MSLQSGAVDLFAHLTSTQVAQLGDEFNIEEGQMGEQVHRSALETHEDAVRVFDDFKGNLIQVGGFAPIAVEALQDKIPGPLQERR